MKKTAILAASITLGILGLVCLSSAQNYELSAEHRDAMKKLEFLVGTWEGEAWSAVPNQDKETMFQTEVVRWDLDGSVLLVRGLGKKIDPDTQKEILVHEALGILSYDPQQKQYRFATFLADGRSTIAEAHFTEDGELIWTIEAGNGYTIRYRIKLNETGQWTEAGEWSRDGESWSPFFGMTLDRKK